MTATFNSTTTKQSAPDSLKTILDREVEDSVNSIPDRIPESKNQNALIKQNFLVAFGSDEESYSDEGEDISGDPFWKPLLEVAAKYGPPFGKKDLCEKHMQYHMFYLTSDITDIVDLPSYHYGHCSYCILDGGPWWNEEWDSWSEVTSRSLGVIYLGFQDFLRKVCYLPKQDNIHLNNSNMKHFCNLYHTGQMLGETNISGSAMEDTIMKMFRNIV